MLIGIMLASLAGCSGSSRHFAHGKVPGSRKTPTRTVKTAPSEVKSEPFESCCSLGRSVQGREIYLYLFVHSDSYDESMNLRPDVEKVLILGGTHGNETTGADMAHRLVIELKKNPELYRNRYVAIIPEVNPDGLAIKARVNANGVDLNRNLPAANWCLTNRGDSFGGSFPCSEPETRALTSLIERFKPDRILTLHSISEGHHGNNFDGPAEPLARVLCENNKYPLLKTMGYPTPGSLGTWAGIERKIPIVTLELARSRSAEQSWQENARGLIAFIQNTNPAIAGTTGQDGQPQQPNSPSKLGG